jgi:hypothetical protein
MENSAITVLGVELTMESFPILFDWARYDKKELERRLLADIKPSEKPQTLLVMLEHDLREQDLK